MKTLAIIGSGDLGLQIAHYAISDGHFQKIVFFDDVSKAQFSKGFEILGTTNDIEACFGQKQFDALTIGIGYKHLQARQSIFERFENKIPFATIVHSTVWKDPTATVESGCVIYPGCIIDAGAVVSANCVVNLGSVIAHDARVSRHTFVSAGVNIAGFALIGQRCNIGIGSTIINNIEITDDTLIGAGTVVIKNIEQSGIYVGNPHKFIR